MRHVHGQPGEYHDGYWVASQSFGYSVGRILKGDATHGQAVKASDHVCLTADVGLGAVGLLVDERVALREQVERREPQSKVSTWSAGSNFWAEVYGWLTPAPVLPAAVASDGACFVWDDPVQPGMPATGVRPG